jgi:hypothetical protein
MLVSRSNRRRGDIIMDENGIIRRIDTSPLPVPMRPVLLHFDQLETETRRKLMLGERLDPERPLNR